MGNCVRRETGFEIDDDKEDENIKAEELRKKIVSI